MPVATRKLCRRCGIEKPAHLFYRRTRGRDGLQSHCKSCMSDANRSGYQRRRDAALEECKRSAARDEEVTAQAYERLRAATEAALAGL